MTSSRESAARRRRPAAGRPRNGTTRLTAGLASGCHAIGVEHGVDVTKSPDALAQLVPVADLHHESVLDHRVLGGAEGLADVDPGLGEGPREVFEQAGPGPGVGPGVDAGGGRGVALPPTNP